jgi:hypothetical protein
MVSFGFSPRIHRDEQARIPLRLLGLPIRACIAIR